MADGPEATMADGPEAEARFLAACGNVYEESPWIARQAWREGARIGQPGLAATLRRVVETSGAEAQLALLRAHPDLAGRLAMRAELTAESAAEQSGAGLDRCTPEEYREFRQLNDRYRQKFGFPFILAVRGHDRAGILAAFRQRLGNDRDREFRAALAEVHRIAGFRLAALAT